MINFKLKKIAIALIVLVLSCSSCSSYRNVPYFQDVDQNTISKEDINNYSPFVIQSGDLLGINVTTDSKGAEAFNYNLNRISGISGDTGLHNEMGSQNSVIGFLVDVNGNINLPYIGLMKVTGLTTNNLAEQLQNKLVNIFNKPVVNVRVLNFKISVLGDVQRPDVFTVQNERITITEALSLAGDLNITGIRNNILLIREINGKREYIPIDLNSKKLFSSPFYYLKNHDVIYVTPNRAKFSSNNTAGFQKVSLIISAISVIALFLVNKKL